MLVRKAGPGDIGVVRALIEEYCAWIGIDLAFQEIAAELDGLPGDYAPPGGVLLVAEVDGRIRGLIASRRLAPGISEMKRLYVQPEGRGRGMARALVAALIEEAVARGDRAVYLDTLPMMGDAQRLYESMGFVDIPPYYDTPIAGTRFMALTLPYN